MRQAGIDSLAQKACQNRYLEPRLRFRGKRGSKTVRTITGRLSAAVETGQCRLRQRVEMQIEADQGRGCRVVAGVRQFVDIDGENRDVVVMRLVAGWRTRAGVPIGPKVPPGPGCAPGARVRF